jgi:hypothetical protein
MVADGVHQGLPHAAALLGADERHHFTGAVDDSVGENPDAAAVDGGAKSRKNRSVYRGSSPCGDDPRERVVQGLDQPRPV